MTRFPKTSVLASSTSSQASIHSLSLELCRHALVALGHWCDHVSSDDAAAHTPAVWDALLSAMSWVVRHLTPDCRWSKLLGACLHALLQCVSLQLRCTVRDVGRARAGNGDDALICAAMGSLLSCCAMAIAWTPASASASASGLAFVVVCLCLDVSLLYHMCLIDVANVQAAGPGTDSDGRVSWRSDRDSESDADCNRMVSADSSSERVRLCGLRLVTLLARTWPVVFYRHLSLLLPTDPRQALVSAFHARSTNSHINSQINSRSSNTASLLSTLLFDPSLRVRTCACSALAASLVDSPLAKWVGPLEPHLFTLHPTQPTSASTSTSLSASASASASVSTSVLSSVLSSASALPLAWLSSRTCAALARVVASSSASSISSPTSNTNSSSSLSHLVPSSSLSQRIVGTIQSLYVTLLWAIERALIDTLPSVLSAAAPNEAILAAAAGACSSLRVRLLASLAVATSALLAATPVAQLPTSPTVVAYIRLLADRMGLAAFSVVLLTFANQLPAEIAEIAVIDRPDAAAAPLPLDSLSAVDADADTRLSPALFLRQSATAALCACFATRTCGPLELLADWLQSQPAPDIENQATDKGVTDKKLIMLQTPSLWSTVRVLMSHALSQTDGWHRAGRWLLNASTIASSEEDAVTFPLVASFVTPEHACTLPSPNVLTFLSRIARHYRSTLAPMWLPANPAFSLLRWLCACLVSGEPHVVSETLHLIEEWTSPLPSAAGDHVSAKVLVESSLEEESSSASEMDDFDFFALPYALPLCLEIFPVLFFDSASENQLFVSIRTKILSITSQLPVAVWLDSVASDRTLATLLPLVEQGLHDSNSHVRATALKALGSPALGRALKKSTGWASYARAVLPFLSLEKELVQAVHVRAVCTLANYAALIDCRSSPIDILVLLTVFIHHSCESQYEKVLTHAIRGLGNIARRLSWSLEFSQGAFKVDIDMSSSVSLLDDTALAQCVNESHSGAFLWRVILVRLARLLDSPLISHKARWNAAFAIGNAFAHPEFMQLSLSSPFDWLTVDCAFHSLRNSIDVATNFKVAINATASLCIPDRRVLFAGSYVPVLSTVLSSLRSFETRQFSQFSEFQNKQIFQSHLQTTFLRLLLFLEPDFDLTEILDPSASLACALVENFSLLVRLMPLIQCRPPFAPVFPLLLRVWKVLDSNPHWWMHLRDFLLEQFDEFPLVTQEPEPTQELNSSRFSPALLALPRSCDDELVAASRRRKRRSEGDAISLLAAFQAAVRPREDNLTCVGDESKV